MLYNDNRTYDEDRARVKSVSAPKKWLSWAMVLGSFQFRGVLQLLHIAGQGPAVIAAGVGRVGYILFTFSIYLPFLMACLLGDG